MQDKASCSDSIKNISDNDTYKEVKTGRCNSQKSKPVSWKQEVYKLVPGMKRKHKRQQRKSVQLQWHSQVKVHFRKTGGVRGVTQGLFTCLKPPPSPFFFFFEISTTSALAQLGVSADEEVERFGTEFRL